MKPQQKWQKLYGTERWRKRARYQLRSHPLCCFCLEESRVTVADHVEPHHGNSAKFFLGRLQSLCRLHHDSSKRRQEARGYDTRIGPDGMPVDPRHPFYVGKC
jgi:5-methylcytosine-specific restriction protein A